MDSKAKLTGGRALLRRLARWVSDERGNIGPILALMVVPIVGSFAIGGETASWYLYHRAQQNAADSAVVAAAIQGGATYATVANAVAAKYGFTTGGNVTVTPTTVTCPAGATVIAGSTCYQVTVANKIPVYLTRVVGYSGDVTLASGARGKAISAKAIAGLTSGTKTFCMIGLSQGITLNGGPGTNLTGCDLLSDNDLACNGQNSDFGVGGGYAVGTNKNSSCGTTPVSGYPAFTDPLASTISSNLSDLSSCT
ncbi:MAG TPA: pilus assembly protein TadG-related protein, partial [Phenylobacterium sp.]|uniref:pilus assembly protein TadG-related protein n=1 Tax=Phenylobacterium sp. TaxID=1871053 RepID=UPI002C3254F9